MDHPRRHAKLAAILLAVALSHSTYRLFRQPCDPEDTASARLDLFQSSNGTDPTDEYTPTNADNDALAENRQRRREPRQQHPASLTRRSLGRALPERKREDGSRQKKRKARVEDVEVSYELEIRTDSQRGQGCEPCAVPVQTAGPPEDHRQAQESQPDRP